MVETLKLKEESKIRKIKESAETRMVVERERHTDTDPISLFNVEFVY